MINLGKLHIAFAKVYTSLILYSFDPLQEVFNLLLGKLANLYFSGVYEGASKIKSLNSSCFVNFSGKGN